MKRIVLLIGGNLGDREYLLEEAEKHLNNLFTMIKKSQVYESSAWGENSEGDYLNRAVIIETEMKPEEVLKHLQIIEDILERKRIRKWGNRTMDIDILYVEDEILNTPTLTVPHPFIQDRKFVLVPLTELLSDFIHPVLNKTNAKLLEDCKDEGSVRLYRA